MDGVRWTHAQQRMSIRRRGKISTDLMPADWKRINISEMERARRVIDFSRDQPWKLRHLLAADGYNVRLMTDADVLDHIAVMLVQGELILSGQRENSSLASSSNEPRAKSFDQQAEASTMPAGAPVKFTDRSIDKIVKVRAEVPRLTHWIEIELLGEDGKPIPFAAYDMSLPDGTKVHGHLDGDGFARVDGLPEAGSCAVRFPELDRDAWERVAALPTPHTSN